MRIAHVGAPAPLSFLVILMVACTLSQRAHSGSPIVRIHRLASKTKLLAPPDCGIDSRSSTHALSGNQSFTVPITSWRHQGAGYEFSLTYNSVGLTDVNLPNEDFARLSRRNGKWSHTYAQWIDLFAPSEHPDDPPCAVLHQNGRTIGFPGFLENGQLKFTSHNPGYSITTGGTFSRQVNCGGSLSSVSLPVSFEIQDAQRTRYAFISKAYNKGSCRLVVHYLLDTITDRYNRQLRIKWTGGDNILSGEPRVASVTGGGGTPVFLRFAYKDAGSLLDRVEDVHGRKHRFEYEPIRQGRNRYKQLTHVVAFAPPPSTASWGWIFDYATLQGYNGSYTADLVVRKTDPDGQITDYEYEAVDLARATEADWDGRIKRIRWTDATESGTVERVIERTVLSQPSTQEATVRMTYPGGIGIDYHYVNYGQLAHLTQYGQLGNPQTARTWTFAYDSHGTVTRYWTPSEDPTGLPLIQADYEVTEYPTGPRVNQVLLQYLQPDGGGIGVSNADGSVLAIMDPASGLPTQLSFWGDNGSYRRALFSYEADNYKRLTTMLIEQPGGNHLTTGLAYHSGPGTELDRSSPITVTNPVNAQTGFSYTASGALGSVTDPLNPMAATTLPDPESTATDHLAATSSAEYYPSGLIKRVADAEGRWVEIQYAPLPPAGLANAGASNFLRLLFKDGSSRYLGLDYGGRVRYVVDENGLRVRYLYNSLGQIKQIIQTFTKTSQLNHERVTTFFYDVRGDLIGFRPPAGTPAGGPATSTYDVSYSYFRHDQNGIEIQPPYYEGRVTRIGYPDGTAENFGYTASGELSWRRRRDGTLITVDRDFRHRITAVHYPATAGAPPFQISYQYDAYGQVEGISDSRSGTTSYAYDALGRPTSVVPPSPQLRVDFSYSWDLKNKRWLSTATLNGKWTFTYAEDTRGRIHSIVNPLAQGFDYEYDRTGNPVAAILPSSAWKAWNYGDRGNVSRIKHGRTNGAVIDNIEYSNVRLGTTDFAGRVRTETSVFGSTGYDYDPWGQLVAESPPDAPPIYYTYDENGNRLSKSQGAIIEFYGYGLDNRLLWTNQNGNASPLQTPGPKPWRLFSYDLNGQPTDQQHVDVEGGPVITDSYTWDGAGKLVALLRTDGHSLFVQYTPGGTRATQVVDGTTHTYSYQHDSANDTLYTGAEAQRRGGPTGVDRFFHQDVRGTTRWLTDAKQALTSGYRHDAFGVPVAGPKVDETSVQYGGAFGYEAGLPGGLLAVGARYYDPNLGRFLSPDPLGFAGGMNPYAYCGNDPVNMVDPEGESPLLVTGGVGAVVGGIVGAGVAWWNGENVWAGLGKGALIGGIMGLTGGAAYGPAAAWATGLGGSAVTAGIVGGAVGGAVGDAVGQATELALHWRCQYDPARTVGATILGGIAGGGFVRFQQWWAARPQNGPCFVAGTPVSVVAVATHAVDIAAGDTVLLRRAGEGATHEVASVVRTATTGTRTHLIVVSAGDPSSRRVLQLGSQEVIRVLPVHPGESGTEILTVPIEQLRPGMIVPSRNPESGSDSLRRAVRTYASTVQETVTLTLADARGRVVETLTGTPEHPFFTAERGIVPMGRLGIGTSIVTRAGPPLRVASVRRERSPAGVRVYNLEVDEDHTYFVGSVGDGAWVHNQCGIPELVFDYNKHPELADNIWHAQKAGHPSILTRGNTAAANRAAALTDIPEVTPGSLSRDEYPFASTVEGGPGAWVGHVPIPQQWSQAGLLGSFIRRHRIPVGGQFRVRVINHPGGP